MDVVKKFNDELSSLYENNPPISRAKMTSVTKAAIKGIKFYKHIVQSIEKFIQKCKPEYKVPGLYVVDSIVRQSRHQFGPEKDVFGPRLLKNIRVTFHHLFKCPSDEKPKIVRVLNLWQKNGVFPANVIQPLLDLAADPDNSSDFPNYTPHKKVAKVHPSPQHRETIHASGDTSKLLSGLTGGSAASQEDTMKLLQSLLTQSPANLQMNPLQSIQFVQQHLLQRMTTPQPIPNLGIDPAALASLSSTLSALTGNRLPVPTHTANLPTTAPLSIQQQIPTVSLSLPQSFIAASQQMSVSKPELPFNKGLLDFDYGDDSDTSPQAPSPQQRASVGIPGLGLQDYEKSLIQSQTQQFQQGFLANQYSGSNVYPAQNIRTPNSAGVRQRNIPPIVSGEALQTGLQSNGSVQPTINSQPRSTNQSFNPVDTRFPFSGIQINQFPKISPENMIIDQQHQSGQLIQTQQDMVRPIDNQFVVPPVNIPLPTGAPPSVKSHTVPVGVRPLSMTSHDKPFQYEDVDSRRNDFDDRRTHYIVDNSHKHDEDDRYRRSHRSRSRERRSKRSKSRERREEERKEREKERDRRKEREKLGFPDKIRPNTLQVCSLTLWLGHVPKNTTESEMRSVFGNFGPVVSVFIIGPRGCAFICMLDRAAAKKALGYEKAIDIKGNRCKMAWAPGKGVQNFKNFWDVDQGVCYIPWNKLPTDLESLKDGSVIDPDSLPPHIEPSVLEDKPVIPVMTESPTIPTFSNRAHSQLAMPPNILVPNEHDLMNESNQSMMRGIPPSIRPGFPMGFQPRFGMRFPPSAMSMGVMIPRRTGSFPEHFKQFPPRIPSIIPQRIPRGLLPPPHIMMARGGPPPQFGSFHRFPPMDFNVHQMDQSFRPPNIQLMGRDYFQNREYEPEAFDSNHMPKIGMHSEASCDVDSGSQMQMSPTSNARNTERDSHDHWNRKENNLNRDNFEDRIMGDQDRRNFGRGGESRDNRRDFKSEDRFGHEFDVAPNERLFKRKDEPPNKRSRWSDPDRSDHVKPIAHCDPPLEKSSEGISEGKNYIDDSGNEWELPVAFSPCSRKPESKQSYGKHDAQNDWKVAIENMKCDVPKSENRDSEKSNWKTYDQDTDNMPPSGFNMVNESPIAKLSDQSKIRFGIGRSNVSQSIEMNPLFDSNLEVSKRTLPLIDDEYDPCEGVEEPVEPRIELATSELQNCIDDVTTDNTSNDCERVSGVICDINPTESRPKDLLESSRDPILCGMSEPETLPIHESIETGGGSSLQESSLTSIEGYSGLGANTERTSEEQSSFSLKSVPSVENISDDVPTTDSVIADLSSLGEDNV